jgi:hypothetical protein
MLKFSLTWHDGGDDETEPPGWMLEIEGEGDLEGSTGMTLLLSEPEFAALSHATTEARRP